MAAFGTAARQDSPAVFGGHAYTESMCLRPFAIIRLKGAFWHLISSARAKHPKRRRFLNFSIKGVEWGVKLGPATPEYAVGPVSVRTAREPQERAAVYCHQNARVHNNELQDLRDAGYKPSLVGPRPFSFDNILQNISPAPDEETERFVAEIYADRRQAGEHAPSE
jgi:hypothetical protein